MRKSHLTLPIAMCAALIAQSLVLAFWSGARGAVLSSTVVICFVGCLLIIVRRRVIENSVTALVLLSPIAFGGLGMLGGAIMDGAKDRSCYSCCLRTKGIVPNWKQLAESLTSWSTVVMVATCLSACLILCPRNPRVRRLMHSWQYHGFTSLTMLLGMHGGGWYLTPLFSCGNSIVAEHLAMVFGMSFGTMLGHRIMLGASTLGVR
jgi:hypothetical protein